MNPPVVTLVASALLLLPSLARGQYVRTDICSTCSACIMADNTTLLFDDGLHGDGAAGDGVAGAYVTVDKPAGKYYWYVGSEDCMDIAAARPSCWTCGVPPVYLSVWTTGPGDVVHFVVDNRPRSGGWDGCGLACDHGMPSGSQLELYWWNEAYGAYGYVPAQKQGSIWQSFVRLPRAGSNHYNFVSRSVVSFNLMYNGWCGCTDWRDPAGKPTIYTSQPDTDVLFQFDEESGLMRAIEGGITPAQRTTWGALKQIYR